MLDAALFPPNYFGNLFLVMVRVGGMLFSAPLLQGRAVPAMVKVGLTVLVAVLLLPINAAHLIEVPMALIPLSLLVLKEMGVGILVGYVVNLIFSGLQLAGQFIGMQIGFSMANVIDPLFSQNISIVDQLYTVVAGLIFLAMDGHHMLILAVQQTLDLIPLGTFAITGSLFSQLAVLTAGVFVVGLRVALPLLATLLLTDIALGLTSRGFPQMNIFVVGLPVKIGLGMFIMIAALPAVNTLVRGLFMSAFADLANLMRLAG